MGLVKTQEFWIVGIVVASIAIIVLLSKVNWNHIFKTNNTQTAGRRKRPRLMKKKRRL